MNNSSVLKRPCLYILILSITRTVLIQCPCILAGYREWFSQKSNSGYFLTKRTEVHEGDTHGQLRRTSNNFLLSACFYYDSSYFPYILSHYSVHMLYLTKKAIQQVSLEHTKSSISGCLMGENVSLCILSMCFLTK